VNVPAFTLPQRFRVRRLVNRYGRAQGWTGPVERRDPATYQDRPRDCGLTRCTNEWCKLWLVSGTPRCPHCHCRQDVS
jgi:hypothetical protein